MKSCIFCDVIAGTSPRTVIYEDESVLVIKDRYPAAALHWLFLPKKHTKDLMELSSAEVTTLLTTIQKLISKHNISRYRVVTNGGGAQQIDHTHIHLMGAVDKHHGL